MTPAQLKAMGKRLFGRYWQSAVARKLDVNRTTVWRWAAKRIPIPPDQVKRLRALQGPK